MRWATSSGLKMLGKGRVFFGYGVCYAPGFPDRLRVEEPQSREPLRHGGCSQLSLAEQIRLVLANVLRSELIRRATKVTRKIFDRLDVAVDGSLSVITTLEFFEHHFAKVGHRLAPYDPTLFAQRHTADTDTRKRLPLRLRSNELRGDQLRSPRRGLLARNNFRLARQSPKTNQPMSH